MSETAQAEKLTGKQKMNNFVHKLFGSTPGDGELQPKEGFSYSLCGFGQNLICTIIGSYLTVFMTDAIGFGALSVALLMLFARIYDALNDPIMGSIVDRTRTKWGKCRPYMKWMAIPIAVMTILCFLPWYNDTPGGFAAISVMYVIWGMVYTVADVPYWGLSTAMSNDTYRRGNLLTIARLFCTLGAGLVTIIVPMVTSNTTAVWQTELSIAQNMRTSITSVKTDEKPDGYDWMLVKSDISGLLSQIPDIDGYEKDGKEYGVREQIDTFVKYLNDKDYKDNPAIVALRDYLYRLNVEDQHVDGNAYRYDFIVFKNNQWVLRASGSALLNVVDTDIDLSSSESDLLASLDGIIKNDTGSIQNRLKWIYFITAVICCVVAIPLFFLGFKNTTERNVSVENPPSLGHNLKLLFKNKPLMLIVLSGIGGAARLLFTYTGGLYFAKYVLADVSILGGFMKGEGLYTLFTLAIVPGGLIASLLVPWCTKKFGKKNTYIWSHVIGGVAMLIAFIVGITTGRGDYTNIATIVCLIIALVIAGIPSGFGNILTYAMIGDTVEYLELKTGERAEGICFAMQTLINKIGMAVGAFIGVLSYELAGVEANNPSLMGDTNKDTMWIMLVGIAALSFFLTVIPLFFYKFNEKEQQEAKAEIEARKGANAQNDEITENVEDGGAAQIVFPNEDSMSVAIDENGVVDLEQNDEEETVVNDEESSDVEESAVAEENSDNVSDVEANEETPHDDAE